ncbi:hypothetical protein HGA13_08415 [Nocardia speluncae]|uniref:Uncharacterized protein n=1 Tax=Nocardia speluncae TaxID=419477 RepID=A0A846XA01_9NOCA|nr:hypothetical protein [Nocardia speluncae]NKY33091.1 hypothetical protein [Nocardia speluncae]
MALTPIDNAPQRIAAPTKIVATVGALVAVWCAIFAAISFWFEFTEKFATGPHAANADAISVMNWYVAALKLLGVAVAVLAVTQPPKFLQPKVVGTILWAAFSTVVIYVVGSLTQAAVMLTGVAGDAEHLDLASGGYVFAFLLASAGFGILALSYARRAGLGKREVLLGICGGPLVLGSTLFILPALLRVAGMLSG